MDGGGPVPSPVARLLLSLAERQATGSVDVGGRQVMVADGGIVRIDPTPGDDDIGDFLRSASRVSTEDLIVARAEAQAADISVGEALQRLDKLGGRALADTQRALWLDRLVRGITQSVVGEECATSFMPAPPAAGDTTPLSLVPFVFDALERRAAERGGDAETIGAREQHYFYWVASPHHECARNWLGVTEASNGALIASLLGKAPAAAPRIAALVRADLVRIAERRLSSAPPPPPRSPSLAPSSKDPAWKPSADFDSAPNPGTSEAEPSEAFHTGTCPGRTSLRPRAGCRPSAGSVCGATRRPAGPYRRTYRRP